MEKEAGIKQVIAKFWYDKPENIELIPNGNDEWKIRKKESGKEITSSKVTFSKGRFRFEGI